MKCSFVNVSSSLLCQWRAQASQSERSLPDWKATGSAVVVIWNETDLVFPEMLFLL